MRFCSLMLALAVPFATVATCTLAASPVSAQEERDRARAEFQRGVDAYGRSDFQTALDAFQEAYRLSPHPSVRVNIANCYEQLHRPLEALFHFEHFLSEAQRPSAPQRREVEAAVRRMQQLVGTIAFQVTPDGALVTIDGTDSRRAPVSDPVRVVAGRHQIDILLDGFVSERQVVDVAGGEVERVAVRLSRPGAVASAGAGAGSSASSTGQAGAASSSTVASAGTSATAATTAGSGGTASASASSSGGSGAVSASSGGAVAVSAAPSSDSQPAAEGSEGSQGAVASDDHGDTLAAPHTAPGGPALGGFELTTPVLVAGGVTVAAAIGMAITGGVALSANSSFDQHVAVFDDPSQPADVREQARVDGLGAASDAHTFAAVSDALLVTTVLGAGATAFLFFTTQDGGLLDDEQAPSASRGASVMALPVIDREMIGAVVAGAF